MSEIENLKVQPSKEIDMKDLVQQRKSMECLP